VDEVMEQLRAQFGDADAALAGSVGEAASSGGWRLLNSLKQRQKIIQSQNRKQN
jgi:hypothetical protein